MRLNDEAEKEPDVWHWRIFPNGIEVALRRRVDDLGARYDLRLTRRECEVFRDSDIAWRGTGNICLEDRQSRVGILQFSLDEEHAPRRCSLQRPCNVAASVL